MEQWGNHLIKLNVDKEEKFEINIDSYDDTIEHIKDELEDKLIEFKKQKSKEKNIPVYYAFTNEVLYKILQLKPKIIKDFKKADFLLDVKIKLHGNETINEINIKC